MFKDDYCAIFDKIVPDQKLLSSVTIDIEGINAKRRTVSDSSLRPVKIIALIIVAITILGVSTIAVAQHFGAFDRLREIVGAEREKALQPVTNWVLVTEDGLRLEIIAAAVHTNVLDIYIKLEDLEGKRLDNGVSVYGEVFLRQEQEAQPIAFSSEIIDRTDDGIVTLHNRQVYISSIAEQKVEFRLHDISYNFREAEIEIDFDLTSVVQQLPAAVLWDTPILQPHLHDIDVSLEGFDGMGSTVVSSIGIINGRLHIQEKYDRAALYQWVSNRVQLISPRGEVVFPLRGTQENTASISFEIDQQGNYYNDKGFNFVSSFPYRENIFEVDLAQLSEYKLVTYFAGKDQSVLHNSFIFEVEVPGEDLELSASDLHVSFDCNELPPCPGGSVTVTEVLLSPVSLIVKGYSQQSHSEYAALVAGRAKIHMRNGEVLDVPQSGAARTFSDIEKTGLFLFIVHIELGVDYLNPGQVNAIEIAGEVIPLR